MDLNNLDFNQVALKATVIEAPRRYAISFKGSSFDVMDMKVIQKTRFYDQNKQLKEFDKKITIKFKDKDKWAAYEKGIVVGMKIMIFGKAEAVVVSKDDFIKPLGTPKVSKPAPAPTPAPIPNEVDESLESDDIPF